MVSFEHFNQDDCDGNGGAMERSALLWQPASRRMKRNRMEGKDKRFMKELFRTAMLLLFSELIPAGRMIPASLMRAEKF
jgi:hypothetical protein